MDGRNGATRRHDMNATTIINNAIAEARAWIVAGTDTDNAEMKTDHAGALNEFDACVKEDRLVAACNICIDLAREWASADYSGFPKLDRLTDLLGEELEFNGPDEDDSFIVRHLFRKNGRWTVLCGWDSHNSTEEDANILVDAGLLEA
jgi:hypothetical protein